MQWPLIEESTISTCPIIVSQQSGLELVSPDFVQLLRTTSSEETILGASEVFNGSGGICVKVSVTLHGTVVFLALSIWKFCENKMVS